MSQMLNCANLTVLLLCAKGRKREENFSGNNKLISYILCKQQTLFQVLGCFHLKTKSCDKGPNKAGSLSRQQISIGQLQMMSSK